MRNKEQGGDDSKMRKRENTINVTQHKEIKTNQEIKEASKKTKAKETARGHRKCSSEHAEQRG